MTCTNLKYATIILSILFISSLFLFCNGEYSMLTDVEPIHASATPVEYSTTHSESSGVQAYYVSTSNSEPTADSETDSSSITQNMSETDVQETRVSQDPYSHLPIRLSIVEQHSTSSLTNDYELADFGGERGNSYPAPTPGP